MKESGQAANFLFPDRELVFVARAATGHFLPSCRAGIYFFVLKQKNSRQNEASARKSPGTLAILSGQRACGSNKVLVCVFRFDGFYWDEINGV
jgi:hypothetical protein